MSAVVSSQSLAAAAADVQCVCVQMRVENITLGIRQCLSTLCNQQKNDPFSLVYCFLLRTNTGQTLQNFFGETAAASALLLM